MSDREKRVQNQQGPNKGGTGKSSPPVVRKKFPRSMRVMESVPCPPMHRLTIKDIFGSSGTKVVLIARTNR